MPQFQFYPLAGVGKLTGLVRDELAGSFLRLFQEGFEPSAGTPRSAYLAEECDFSGYPAGGIEITAFNAPILTAGSGWQTGSPLEQFAFDSGIGAVGNLVAGGWLEDAAGVQWLAFGFPDSIPMEQDGQGIPLNVILAYATGQ